MDERSESADILALLTLLDGVHGNFDGAPDPFAKAGCLGDYNFHFFLAVRLRSLAFYLRKKMFFPKENQYATRKILPALNDSGKPGANSR